MTTDPEARDLLLKKIKEKRHQIEVCLQDLEPEGTRLTNRTIVLGGIAALLGALQLAFGHHPVSLTKLSADAHISVWQILAALAAVCSGLASIYGQKYKSREIASRLAKTQGADAKLDGLETSLQLGLSAIKEASTRHNQIIAEIPWVHAVTPLNLRGRASLDAVKGQIKFPGSNQTVSRAFDCNGVVTGVGPNIHLWLAVEVGGLKWPKEGQVTPDDDGSWTGPIFEDGATDEFCVSLWAADDKGHKKIQAWLAKGLRTGTYEELKSLPRSRRVARIEGLRLSK
jgi:hypothetical protein